MFLTYDITCKTIYKKCFKISILTLIQESASTSSLPQTLSKVVPSTFLLQNERNYNVLVAVGHFLSRFIATEIL